MRRYIRRISLILCALLAVAMCGCSQAPTAVETEPPAVYETPTPETVTDTVKVGVSGMTGKLNPFFFGSVADAAAVGLTQLRLIGITPEGEPDFEGRYGLASLEIVKNSDGTADYRLSISDDRRFSDGTPVGVEDVIFSMYVLSDPEYDGPSGFASLPIVGMDAYRATDTLGHLIYAAGEDNADYSLFSASQQEEFWSYYYGNAVVDFAEALCERAAATSTWSLDNFGGSSAAYAMFSRGLARLESEGVLKSASGRTWYLTESVPDAVDLAQELLAAYDFDYHAIENSEPNIPKLEELTINALPELRRAAPSPDSVRHIAGIETDGESSVTIHMEYEDPSAPELLQFYVAPLHYFGSNVLYSPERECFGFVKGELDDIRSKTKCVGAGAYKLAESSEDAVRLTLRTENSDFSADVLFVDTESSLMDYRLRDGELDIALCTPDAELGEGIGRGECDLQKLWLAGFNADRISAGADASRSAYLRSAFAVMLCGCRREPEAEGVRISDSLIAGFEPDAASAAGLGFRTGINGAQLYDGDSTYTERCSKALEASISYFEAAGFTWDGYNGRFTAAPSGGKLAYTMLIPDRRLCPEAGLLADSVQASLQTVGIRLSVVSVTDEAGLISRAVSGEADIWISGWNTKSAASLRPLLSANGSFSSAFGANTDYDSSLALLSLGESGDAYRLGAALRNFNAAAAAIPLYEREFTLAERAGADVDAGVKGYLSSGEFCTGYLVY